MQSSKTAKQGKPAEIVVGGVYRTPGGSYYRVTKRIPRYVCRVLLGTEMAAAHSRDNAPQTNLFQCEENRPLSESVVRFRSRNAVLVYTLTDPLYPAVPPLWKLYGGTRTAGVPLRPIDRLTAPTTNTRRHA